MYPGEFSIQEANRPMPTVPAILNVQQREHLEKNTELNSDRSPSNANNESTKTVVPDGLSGALVSNNSDVLKNEKNYNDCSLFSYDSVSCPIMARENGRYSNDYMERFNGYATRPACALGL